LTDVNKKCNYDKFNYKCKYKNNDIRIISFKSNDNYIHLATNIFNKNKNIDYSNKIRFMEHKSSFLYWRKWNWFQDFPEIKFYDYTSKNIIKKGGM
jgi:hypothetical protein